MAVLIRLDTPPMQDEAFHPDFKRWLAVIVDNLNEVLEQLENETSNNIAAQTANIGGAGAGPIDVAVPGLTAASVVTASIVSSSNPVSIIAVLPGVDKFSVTFSANPGASAIISYVAYIAAQ